jgi:NTP pyrophosphatase (non-canonical NTP hydrolase)
MVVNWISMEVTNWRFSKMTSNDVQIINRVSEEVYKIAAAHGFHEGESVMGTDVDVGRLAKYCVNLHGEVSELWEAGRKGKLNDLCDKVGCELTCVEEELADIVIRAMDCAVGLGIDLGKSIQRKSEYNHTRPYMHGKLA